MAKTKKERRMSKRFSRIKKELKKQGIDVSKVKKSQKTHSSIEDIRKDILSQIGKYNKKETFDLKKAEETANQLQSAFGRTFNTKADDTSQDDGVSYEDDTSQDDGVSYETFNNLPRARKEDADGYPIIYNFYEALDDAIGSEYEEGISINDADTLYVTRDMVEKIKDTKIRKWALQAFNKKNVR